MTFSRPIPRHAPVLLAALLLSFSAPSAAVLTTAQTSDLPEGSVCSSNGAFTYTCAASLVCELTKVADEASGFESVGRCRSHPTPPPACAIWRCAQYGADSTCTLGSNIITCGAWAASASFPECPRCPEAENWNCATKSFLASTGVSYCTECALRTISCRNDFTVYGPVREGGCYPPMADGRATCCRTKGVACAKVLDDCKIPSVSNPDATADSVPCGQNLICATKSVPAGDVVKTGFCASNSVATRWCSVWMCSQEGQDAVCSMPAAPGSSLRISGTCGAWATRMDGGQKPNCDITCDGGCVFPRENRPISTGRYRYCSECVLRRASCEAEFRVWRWLTPSGPVFGDKTDGCPEGTFC